MWMIHYLMGYIQHATSDLLETSCIFYARLIYSKGKVGIFPGPTICRSPHRGKLGWCTGRPQLMSTVFMCLTCSALCMPEWWKVGRFVHFRLQMIFATSAAHIYPRSVGTQLSRTNVTLRSIGYLLPAQPSSLYNLPEISCIQRELSDDDRSLLYNKHPAHRACVRKEGGPLYLISWAHQCPESTLMLWL